MTNEIIELLNKINMYEGDSLTEKILTYCEEQDIEPEDIGDQLKDSECFKRKLKIDAVQNFQMKDELLMIKMNQNEDLNEW